MVGMFLLITFLIYISYLYLKLVRGFNITSSIIVFFGYLVVSYILTIVTKNIFLTNKIVILIFLLFSFISLFSLVLKYKNNIKQLIRYLLPYLFSVVLAIIVYAFSIFGIRDFVSLMPLSDSANQLSIVQNVYFGSSLIAIDRSINTLPLLVGNFLSLINGLSSSEVSNTYINLVSLLFYFGIFDLLIQIWISNNKVSKVLNNGVILFVGSLFSFTLFKFSYLSHLWLLFPVTYIFLGLFNTGKILDYILLGLSFLSLFVLGLDFKLVLLIAIILFVIWITLVCYRKFNQLQNKKRLFILVFIGFIFTCNALYIFGLRSFNWNFYVTPNTSNIFFSCFDISSLNFSVIIFLICIFVFNLLRQEKLSEKSFVILMAIAICFNPLILDSISSMRNFQVLQYILFNPFIYCFVFDNFEIDFEKSYVINSIVVMMAVSNQLMVNPYFTNNSHLYDLNARIEKDELEIDQYLSTVVNEQEIKVVSQAPFTKAFTSNVTLLEDYNSMMLRCQYCDVLADNLHEPNQLINIFAYREYSGNQLFIEAPDYGNALSLTINGNYHYLILRNDQIIEYNNNWIPLSELFIEKYEVIIKNDTYILMGLMK